MTESMLNRSTMTRRDFMKLGTMAAAGCLAGCAVNPVTGVNQLMLMNEGQEISVDQENSPHQFSADYGALTDSSLNGYIAGVGLALGKVSHRPQMPYSFRGVNANYVNAYAFPGGSIAVTRGMLLKMENEAELAALLGHELGHVNARHTASQMSKGMLTQMLAAGAVAAVGDRYRAIAEGIGMVGTGALLASYSRDNERQADELGMEYMVKGGYSPLGMVGLMEILKDLSDHKASAADLMFATHPMSDERYDNALHTMQSKYGNMKSAPLHRERYMDHTSSLRAMAGVVETLEKGEAAMGKKKYGEARTLFRKALKQAPGDYTGLVLMAKCMLVQEQYGEAQRYAERAKRVYPAEAQGHHVSGYASIKLRRFDAALHAFNEYDRLLPGNPPTSFFKGYALEGMQRIDESARAYNLYLQSVQEGDMAQHAYGRLVQWGYVKP